MCCGLVGIVVLLGGVAHGLSLARIAQIPAPTPRSVQLAAEFALIAQVAGELHAGREAAAKGIAATDPRLARAAFEELMADAVYARLRGAEPAFDHEDGLLALFATASGQGDAPALLAKLPQVAKGANPFTPSSGAFEAVLASICAVDQVPNPDDLAGGVEQEKRARAALDSARASDNLVATYSGLGLLGLFAFEGGDMRSAARHWAEAATSASRAGHVAAEITFRRSLAIAYARERSLVEARREASAAEALLASVAAPSPALKDVALNLYRELVSYNEQLGDRTGAIAALEREAAFLGRVGAPAQSALRADVFEQLARLYAQNAVAARRDAEEGARAFVAAAEAWLEAGKRDRAMIDLTAAGVLLVENVGGREARPLFERARALAEGLKDRSSVVGAVYWLGRTYLAESSDPNPTAARAARARAIALLADAAARTERLARGKSAADFAELRATIAFWAGRARLAGPAPDVAGARQHFQRALDTALAAGDVNAAVLYAEWHLRAASRAIDVDRTAIRLFDALMATKRLAPARTAETLASVLEEDAPQPAHALRSATVALFERAAAANDGASATSALAALIRMAADAGDSALLAARAEKAFDALVSAKAASGGVSLGAQDLAERVADAWTELGNPSEAARWRSKLWPLAQESYEAARAASGFEEAALAAERLTRAATADERAADVTAWARAAAAARLQVADAYESQGKLGLAAENARQAASTLFGAGQYVQARESFDRAAKLAASADDRSGQAEALARRARAELSAGDARSSILSAQEALVAVSGDARLLTGTAPLYPLPSSDALPLPVPAFGALLVRGDAHASLADGGQPERLPGGSYVPTREESNVEAVRSYELAIEIRERTRTVVQIAGEKPLVRRVGDHAVYERIVTRLLDLGRIGDAVAYAVRAELDRADVYGALPEPAASAAHQAGWDLILADVALRASLANRTAGTVTPAQQVATARHRFETALEAARSALPAWQYYGLAPWKLDAAALRRAVAPDAASLQYFAAGDRVYAFVVRRDRILARDVTMRAGELDRLIELAERATVKGGLPADVSGRLYEALLAPVVGDLDGVAAACVFPSRYASALDLARRGTRLDGTSFRGGSPVPACDPAARPRPAERGVRVAADRGEPTTR
jgi:hypothetical protein